MAQELPYVIDWPAVDAMAQMTRLSPSHQDWVKSILASRYTELEKHIRCFYECGVSLDRMQIIDSRDHSTITLYVDGIARFQWRLKGYFEHD